jgi:NADH-quinone oxidoreductase subunit L
VTAFLAATIAIVQTDIKKVLAYSTVSQLGYMFLGCGVGAFSAGIFHLVTHAFFKALLFLGAGSVIHAMSGEQEMPRMGGLRAHLPSTYRTMLIGALALAGIPPLAGFFSKDEILGKAWEDGHLWLWLMGSVTALLTAFYVFRLIYLTFFGAPRMSAEARHHLHESPAVMTVPLWILAGLAAVGGVLGLPAALGFGNFLEGWLEPALASAPAHAAAEGAEHAAAGGQPWLLGVAALIAVAGWMVARFLYQARPEVPVQLAARAGALYRVLKGKYFVDEIYQLLFVRSCIGGAWALDRFDRHVVDGTVNGSGAGVEIAGQIVKLFHTGYVRNYALSFFLGVVFILWFMLVR